MLLVAGFPTAGIRPQDHEIPAFGFDHVSRSTVPFSWGPEVPQRKRWREIPTELSLERFREFVLPHLSVGSRGPAPKLSLHALFNYILKLLYLGCQWKELPIEKDDQGREEIHYSGGYRAFRRWEADGCFDAIFAGTVLTLRHADLLDVTVIHGDGTTTAAKKGGDNIGFSGHKKVKGDKVVAFCDRNCNVIAPFISAPGNQNESPLLREALPTVMRMADTIELDLRGTIVSLDGVYDCQRNRKAIFNRGMVPNINPNPRGRKSAKRGRKPLFDAGIFKERFNTIERVFGWEDKFRRLLLRFERLSQLHYAFKSLAYSMINLRHFC
jgi:transposase